MKLPTQIISELRAELAIALQRAAKAEAALVILAKATPPAGATGVPTAGGPGPSARAQPTAPESKLTGAALVTAACAAALDRLQPRRSAPSLPTP